MSKIGFNTENEEGYLNTEVPLMENTTATLEGTIKVTPDTRKAIEALARRTYPQYKVSKCRMAGQDLYYIEVRPHWWNRWHTITDLECMPIYFLTFDDAVRWLTE